MKKREDGGQALSRPASGGTPRELPETAGSDTHLWTLETPAFPQTPCVRKPAQQLGFLSPERGLLCQGATGSEDTGRVTSSKFENQCVTGATSPRWTVIGPQVWTAGREPLSAQGGFTGPERGVSRARCFRMPGLQLFTTSRR